MLIRMFADVRWVSFLPPIIWDRIDNTSFFPTNGPTKLECYITQSWKGLPGTNTPAWWAHSSVAEKMRCCEYGPCLLRFQNNGYHNSSTVDLLYWERPNLLQSCVYTLLLQRTLDPNAYMLEGVDSSPIISWHMIKASWKGPPINISWQAGIVSFSIILVFSFCSTNLLLVL